MITPRSDGTDNSQIEFPELTSEFHLRQYLTRVLDIQHNCFCRSIESIDKIPLDIADLFEDTANRYLDLADSVRDSYREEQNSDG